MIILGINAFHPDSSACILKDGVILNAVEEERFSRIKHTSCIPFSSIDFCLDNNNLSISDIDFISINSNPYSNFSKKISFSLFNAPNIFLISERLFNLQKKLNILEEFEKYYSKNITAKLFKVDHHISHLASTFFASSFDESSLVSVDGFGDFASTSIGYGLKNNINLSKQVYFPHSLGIFYECLTQYLGFNKYGDEYKVMGLSSYGESKYIKELNEIIFLDNSNFFKLNLNYFNHHKKNLLKYKNNYPIVDNIFNKNLENKFGPARKPNDEITRFHLDLAKSVQQTYENIFLDILNKVYKNNQFPFLCLAGGCINNSVANGKIFSNTGFKNIFIQPASGDAGGSLGSAYYAWSKLNHKRPSPMSSPYIGPSFSNDVIKHIIDQFIELKNFDVKFIEDYKILNKNIAFEINKNKIIGWFQDNMELGPRALGNRSILANPGNPKIKEIINSKIKRRESFRPFAPSILLEEVKNWFEVESDCFIDIPSMMQVFTIIYEKRKLIPGVTHVDGTGRLQTVGKHNNLKYYDLINQFFLISKIPMLLNTSFNENEPIVNLPEEAINCFLRTDMDILVMQNWIISR